MLTQTSSNAVGNVPDMYCNFTYDMISASMKEAFSNLRSTKHNYEGANFFSFLDEDYDELVDNEGYMYDYMCSTTLNPDKIYILASDYFTDLIRAFFVVPVNKALLESVGMQVTGDKDLDGKFTIKDFYAEVTEKKWNYTKVAEYSEKIYQSGPDNVAEESINDVLGFAISAGGLAASGLLYSNELNIINKTQDKDGSYLYTYSVESQKLVTLFNNAKTLVESRGVYVAANSEELKLHGPNHLSAIRKRFCESKVLFGDVVMLGVLDLEEYQRLKDGDGFGIVPVPMNNTENYLTAIHNVGRSGAISANTAKFAECTAFLNYQSTHSDDILHEYYEYYFQYSVADGSVYTLQMLEFIRSNIRSTFDKNFEDILIPRLNDVEGVPAVSWHGYLTAYRYAHGAEIEATYASLRDIKHYEIQNIARDYENLQ